MKAYDVKLILQRLSSDLLFEERNLIAIVNGLDSSRERAKEGLISSNQVDNTKLMFKLGNILVGLRMSTKCVQEEAEALRISIDKLAEIIDGLE